MEILYEDDSVVVCYKEPGVPTQTKQVGTADLESLLIKYRSQKNEKAEIFVVHRLDQPVEGVMVFAKTKEAAARLSSQINKNNFGKKYFAVISNPEFPKEDELVDFLAKDQRTNTSKVVNKNNPQGKEAKLKYRMIDEWDDKQLLDIELFSGRHHQIRVQLSSRKAPIVGDSKYGGIKTGRPLALCSHELVFIHPVNGKRMEFNITPKGEDFKGSKALV